MDLSKVLVFGSGGQVGHCLRALLPQATFADQSDCDFRQNSNITAYLEHARPNVIVNAAAYTNVDRAETEFEAASQINAEAPAAIAEWCARNGSKLVHYSTDYVYSGEGAQPWRESDVGAPINRYGLAKLAGDMAIQKSGCAHVILRTSWVYSAFGNNFAKTMLRLGLERERLNIVADQIGSPTAALDIAEATLCVLSHPRFGKENGVFHLVNSGYTSWHGFATAIFTGLRDLHVPLRVRELEAIPSVAYKTPAQRPLNSRLDTGKIKAAYGIEMQDWQRALLRQLPQIAQSAKAGLAT